MCATIDLIQLLRRTFPISKQTLQLNWLALSVSSLSSLLAAGSYIRMFMLNADYAGIFNGFNSNCISIIIHDYLCEIRNSFVSSGNRSIYKGAFNLDSRYRTAVTQEQPLI